MPKPKTVYDPFTGRLRVDKTIGDGFKQEYAARQAADEDLARAAALTPKRSRAVLRGRDNISATRIA